MRRPGLTATAFQVLALALFLAPISVGAQESSPPSGNKSHAAKKSVLGPAVAPVKSPPLRDIRPIPPSTTDHLTVRNSEFPFAGRFAPSAPSRPDPSLQARVRDPPLRRRPA